MAIKSKVNLKKKKDTQEDFLIALLSEILFYRLKKLIKLKKY